MTTIPPMIRARVDGIAGLAAKGQHPYGRGDLSW
jgi:hypothetical protein